MNKEKIKQICTIENLLYLFLIMCPILDASSFIFRNKFHTNISISTFVRPIIPIIVIIYIFFKDNIKKQLTIAGLIYAIYAIIHLILFKKILTTCAYGNTIREAQYIVNYTFMIMNLFIYIYVFIYREKDEEKKKASIQKIKKAILIMLTIYIALMYIAILTKTSSYTYIEDSMGYKGWFESGNSIGAIMILSLFIIIPMLNKENDKKINIWIIADTILTIIYLSTLLGTRTGLIGAFVVIIFYIICRITNNFINSSKINKKTITIGISIFTIFIIVVAILGSATIQRRKLLKQRESQIYDTSLGENAHVTGDILDMIPKIENHTMPESYMSYEMQESIIDLYNYNNKHHISNTNMRMIQLVYHAELVKNQRDLLLMLFGNGYMSHYYELIFEMEVPAFLYNFGILGLILYFGPFLFITIYGIVELVKNIKKSNINTAMEIIALCFAIASSFLAGYTFFSPSTETIIIAICVMVVNNIINLKGKKSGKNNIWNN